MRSPQEIWEAALGELQLQVNKPNFRTWFKGARCLAYKDNQFVIGVPNTFVAEYLDKNQRSLIEKTLIGLIGSSVTVQFQVNPSRPDYTASYARRTREKTGTPLNPRYTFDSFIVGNCNRVAHAAAMGAAQSPGQSYNPLFIYGGSGLGKTHLLQAIGHMAQANNIRVLYVSGEQFTNDFIGAIREQRTEEFRDKYRSVDILMIDDVQFLSGKEQTEESFFHTFNQLHNSNHQIVITSDRPPKSIPLLQDRLRSRFEWGLVVDIQPPDLDTRLAILKSRTEQVGTELSPEVLEYIARQVQKNIRELEGGLNRVISYSRLLRVRVTIELATKALRDIADKAPIGSDATSPTLLDAVASSFQLTPEDIIGRRRDKEVAQARQVAMYLLKQQNSCSLADIGSALGGRSPSTVSHACDKIAQDIQSSPLLRRKIKEIKRTFQPAKNGVSR